MIRLVDLPALHAPLVGALTDAVRRVLDHQVFVDGPEVAAFEAAFARAVGGGQAVALNSGTAALALGLMSLDLPPGATVATVANTFVATVEAVLWAGLCVAYVDVEPDTGLMDPAALERLLRTARVDAVLPVHLYGAPAALPEIAALAKAYGAEVAVDACQAHGAQVATVEGLASPGHGARFAAYSFYPSKNLGAFGDGGALVTDDEKVAAAVRRLRHHGQVRRDEHQGLGFTERMDTLQAAVLLAKLPHLTTWNDRRRALAALYDEELPPDVRLARDRHGRSACHLYPVRVPARDRIQAALAEAGIESRVYYPRPVHHWLPGLGAKALPVTERLAQEVLCLPLHPTLTEDDVRRVARVLRRALAECP